MRQQEIHTMFRHGPLHIAATIATIVAAISTVGAPFKWSMALWF